eukprot:Gregarina_sp_Poly_1__10915@NODE_853_length_5957_cov_31_132767_g617_i0_p4_GENE_NODE_853_length_5957_cov_31_132767_g617_i0NODE_853_length_5957_cov_31_132767_g617_i0_p4_ORF_typecomplete_len334_score33_06APG6/PF04111_12/9_5e30Sfi1/PF08457_10/1_1_NODE_853_length_5957_cov_31_132767_g617_i08801881
MESDEEFGVLEDDTTPNKATITEVDYDSGGKSVVECSVCQGIVSRSIPDGDSGEDESKSPEETAIYLSLAHICDTCVVLITHGAEDFNSYCEFLLANAPLDCDLPSAWNALLPQIRSHRLKRQLKRQELLLQRINDLKASNQKALTSWVLHTRRMIGRSRVAVKMQEAKYQEECAQRWIAATKREYMRVSRINILNYVFYIWQEGEFGTINHLRLGRLPETPVPIPEINAAFGNVAFLISCILRRLPLILYTHMGMHPFRPKAGRIMVKGSQSYVIKADDDQSHFPLYLTESNVTWYFHIPKFNQGLTALLETFNEIMDWLKLLQNDLQPPMP